MFGAAGGVLFFLSLELFRDLSLCVLDRFTDFAQCYCSVLETVCERFYGPLSKQSFKFNYDNEMAPRIRFYTSDLCAAAYAVCDVGKAVQLQVQFHHLCSS